MLHFESIKIQFWRQFHHVDIDLSRHVTVLTGQNGCGKTTLLNILNRHFGWSLNFVSTPYISRYKAKRLWSDLLDLNKNDPDERPSNSVSIGEILYSDGSNCQLTTSQIVSSQYQLNYLNQKSVEGIHIPSHRPAAVYNPVSQIPTDPTNTSQQYQTYQQILIQLHGSGRAENPGKVQKQSLISLALFGEGNSSVQGNPEFKLIFEGFQEVLRKVMPPSLGFSHLEIRMPEVVMVTQSGDFSLDAMSGGVNTIFSIVWQIYMYGHDKTEFVITIDEPENHLHPSMQRTLLPSLALAFPNCRIIASTHSPFIVSSFPEASIYALTRGSNQRIVSEKLNLSDVSGTPNEVLRDILDVGSNLPVWVENRILEIIEGSKDAPPETRTGVIMEQLEALGIADAIIEFHREKKNAPNS